MTDNPLELANAELRRERDSLIIAASENYPRQALIAARLKDLEERYRWRPIAELSYHFHQVLLIRVPDFSSISIGSIYDIGFDATKWTHFSCFPALSEATFERMCVEAQSAPK